MNNSWNGEERRRRSRRESDFSTTEEVQILHTQFLAISDRITKHREEQDARFDKIQDDLTRIIAIFFPQDGTDGVIQRVKTLEGFKKYIIFISMAAVTWIGSLLADIIKAVFHRGG